MRDYGRVYTRFWSSDDVRSLSDDGKLLALYLLTCEHTLMVGIARLPELYVMEDLKWSRERVREGFAELFRNGFANRCETANWVWVRKFLDWNTPENPNQWKAARKVAAQLPPTCSWAFEFQQDFARRAGDPTPKSGTVPERLPKGSETLSKPVTVTVVGTGTESQSARAGEGSVSRETGSHIELDDVPSQLLVAIKRVHPRGTYRESTWLLTEREIRSALEEGFTAEEIFKGYERYALQCEATGCVGTQYVIGPDRFARERMFREPFPLPEPEKRGKGLSREEQENEDMKALKARRAKMPALRNFRDPEPGESVDDYRKAQDVAWQDSQPRDLDAVTRQLAKSKAVA